MGLQPTPFTYTVLINACGHVRDLPRAKVPHFIPTVSDRILMTSVALGDVRSNETAGSADPSYLQRLHWSLHHVW